MPKWIFGLMLPFCLCSQNYPQDYFKAPLDIPLVLSGTFGELRSNHFHSGIDIKTQQKTGLPILSAAEGTVVRIKISPYGFGKALYVKHPNGYTTVYAHLKSFNKEIEAYVQAQQYLKKSFNIELYPPVGKFQYQQGETIAYSGNTGGSGGPHLHFEIRDSKTEKIINPLLFGFDVKDSRKPEIKSLEVYGFENNELVYSQAKSVLKVKEGSYSLAGSQIIETSYLPSFGIITYDRLDGATNKNGVYQVEYWVGDKRYYSFEAKTFAFSETRYINAHIDYAQKFCCKKTISKLYVEPYNHFSAYKGTKPLDFPALQRDSIYPVKILVCDAAGNTSELVFNVKYKNVETAKNEDPEVPVSIFSPTQSNYFKKDNFQVTIPKGALYNNVVATYDKASPCEDCYSFIHKISSREVPVHKYYTLKIKLDGNYSGDKSKLAIASFRGGKLDDYEGGTYDKGYVKTRTRQFGEFAVIADTVAPVIRPLNFREGSNVSSLSKIKIKIADNLSGIDTYRVYVDGKWVLFEYDAKNALLWSNRSKMNVISGKHQLEVQVADDKGNINRKSFQLIF